MDSVYTGRGAYKLYYCAELHKCIPDILCYDSWIPRGCTSVTGTQGGLCRREIDPVTINVLHNLICRVGVIVLRNV